METLLFRTTLFSKICFIHYLFDNRNVCSYLHSECVLAFGLGMKPNFITSLYSSREEYNKVTKFGFISFTQSEDSHNIGMVYGIEIVPWVDNTTFQVASKLRKVFPIGTKFHQEKKVNKTRRWRGMNLLWNSKNQ